MGRKLFCDSHTIKQLFVAHNGFHIPPGKREWQYLKQTIFTALSAHQEVVHLQKVFIFILKSEFVSVKPWSGSSFFSIAADSDACNALYNCFP